MAGDNSSFFGKNRVLGNYAGEAKPNLAFFTGKITYIVDFTLGQTPSENLHSLRRSYYPSTGKIALKCVFIAPRGCYDIAILFQMNEGTLGAVLTLP